MKPFLEKALVFLGPFSFVCAVLILSIYVSVHARTVISENSQSRDGVAGILSRMLATQQAAVLDSTGGAHREKGGESGTSLTPVHHSGGGFATQTADTLSSAPKDGAEESVTTSPARVRADFPEALGQRFLSTDEGRALLTLQNTERQKKGIAPLVWSSYLADSAEEWANTLASRGCVLKHSGSGYGENIYYSRKYGAHQTPRTPEEVIRAFTDEAPYYHHETNACEDTKICGHYTQIMWANTARVGCAKSLCLSDEREEIWVCHYDPPGNVEGLSPY